MWRKQAYRIIHLDEMTGQIYDSVRDKDHSSRYELSITVQSNNIIQTAKGVDEI